MLAEMLLSLADGFVDCHFEQWNGFIDSLKFHSGRMFHHSKPNGIIKNHRHHRDPRQNQSNVVDSESCIQKAQIVSV
jgi:hypothetical protein